MKILHITHHLGCKAVLDFVAKSLNYNITTQIADWNYNIGHNRAIELWNKYKDYYNQFDVIITSDTVPLSRIFLQNNYAGKLIIWVSNRFDYYDGKTNDCKFPDQEYYQLIRNTNSKNNVKIVPNTKFECEYARKYKNVELGQNIIKPCAVIMENTIITSFPYGTEQKSNTFFIPQYHNDTIFMNLKSKCDDLGINSYCGRFPELNDLIGLKGIIHIPYAWSTIALFEYLSLGSVYLIPSKRFILELSKQHNFWWQDNYALNLIDCAEWYDHEHKDIFLYFDNWEHLKSLAQDNDLIKNTQQNVISFAKNHNIKTLNQWKSTFTNWNI